MTNSDTTDETNFSFTRSLLAGAAAGTAVDLTLFPIDTIKTRLQSAAGFQKSGGFRGIYRGVAAAAIGSAPQAALFFSTYEYFKKKNILGNAESPFSHVLAASAGEFFACLIRVPTENVKQLAQAGVNGGSSMKCAKFVLESEGAKGLFRGFFTTLARDVPFSVIQFPVYELLKNWAGENASPGALAICGAIAGSIGGALTSPTDVAKTRLMLRVDRHGVKYDGMLNTILRVYREEGMRALFSGAGTRIVWISLGGFVFFGTYEWAQESLTKHQIGG